MQAERIVAFSDDYTVVRLIDAWQVTDATLQSCWNFTLSPDIEARAIQDGWMLYHQEKPLLSHKILFLPSAMAGTQAVMAASNQQNIYEQRLPFLPIPT
jgi:hypothetical protein